MQYRIDLAGDTSAAERGAAALRDEGKAARELVAELSGVARAYEEAASARSKAEGAAARPSSTPAFSGARDEDFKRSRWEQDSAGAKAAEQAAAGRRKEDERGEQASTKAAAASSKGAKDSIDLATKAGLGLKDLTRGALAYGAALAGLHSLSDLARMAIGWRGLAQLQMLSWKATMDLRTAVRGVDAQPLVRAATALEKNLSKSTVTGNALSGILTRGFSSVFQAIEKLEPVAEAVFQGMVLGALRAEIAYQHVRGTLAPVTVALEDALGDVDAMGIAAELVETGFKGIAGYVEIMAAGITKAYEVAVKLDEALGGIPGKLAKAAPGFYKSTYGAAADIVTKPFRDVSAAVSGEAPKEDTHGAFEIDKEGRIKVAMDDGEAVGKALGEGMGKGIDGSLPAVAAAGRRLGSGAAEGARAGADAHSPSRKTEQLGDDLDEGAIRGMRRKAGEVARTAGEVLAPDVAAGTPGGSTAPAMGPVSIGQIGPFVFPGLTDKADVRPTVESAIHDALRGALIRLGLPIPGATG